MRVVLPLLEAVASGSRRVLGPNLRDATIAGSALKTKRQSASSRPSSWHQSGSLKGGPQDAAPSAPAQPSPNTRLKPKTVPPPDDPQRATLVRTTVTPIPDTSKLPPLSGPRVHFIGIDYETALKPAHRPNIHTIKYRDPHMILRSIPISFLPPRTTPPFSPEVLAASAEEKKLKVQARGMEERGIPFVVVVGKANVSKFAVVRNKVKRRMMTAVENVVNRGFGLGQVGIHGRDLMTPDRTYILAPFSGAYTAPIEEIYASVVKGLVHLKQQADQNNRSSKGTGRGSSSGKNQNHSKGIGRLRRDRDGETDSRSRPNGLTGL